MSTTSTPSVPEIEGRLGGVKWLPDEKLRIARLISEYPEENLETLIAFFRDAGVARKSIDLIEVWLSQKKGVNATIAELRLALALPSKA